MILSNNLLKEPIQVYSLNQMDEMLTGQNTLESLETRARIYQASQSAILVLSAENSWNLLLLSNLSIKASYQIS